MNRYLQILLTFVAAIMAAGLMGAAVLIGGYYYVAPTLPRAEDLRNVKIKVPLQVYSRDGRLIEEFGDQKRTPVAFEDIPPLLVKAVLAAAANPYAVEAGLEMLRAGGGRSLPRRTSISSSIRASITAG